MAKSFIQGQYKYTRVSQYESDWLTQAWSGVKAGVTKTQSFTKAGTTWEWESGDRLVFVVSYTSGSNLGKVFLETEYGTARTLKDNIVSVTYGGGNSVSIKALKACTELESQIRGTRRSRTQVSATVASEYRDNTVLDDMPDTVSDSGNTYTIVSLYECFQACINLVEAPRLSSLATDLKYCFTGCTSLTTAPTIPNGVDYMSACFYGCTSLTQAPDIPRSVVNMNLCFAGCTSLTGNINVYNSPYSTTYYADIFTNTSQNIFIVYKGAPAPIQIWKTIANLYSNVHYEADDNPIPVISGFTATRVSAVGSTDFEPTGLYAYVRARLMIYDNLIPEGWTNELKTRVLTDSGSVESPTWYPSTIESYPVDTHCWIELGDTSGHNLTLQISDSIKNNGVEVKTQSSSIQSVVVSKSFALIDYYHDPNAEDVSEGMAIGKYAEHPDLLEVEINTNFNNTINSVSKGYVRDVGGYVNGGIQFLDNNGEVIAYVKPLCDVDGQVEGFNVGTSRVVNSSKIWNVLRLQMDASGNPIVYMSQPQAWRKALGLDLIAVTHAVDNLSLSAGGVFSSAKTKNIHVDGYTPICIVNSYTTNASSGGVNTSGCVIYYKSLSGETVSYNIKNWANSVAKIKFNVTVLYRSNI